MNKDNKQTNSSSSSKKESKQPAGKKVISIGDKSAIGNLAAELAPRRTTSSSISKSQTTSSDSSNRSTS